MFSLKDIIKLEVKPALGCTEPIAVALCCAQGASLLPDRDRIKEIEVLVSPGIYKNGMGVFIPGTSGERGLFIAAALGSLAGQPELEMEVLKKISIEDVEKAREMVLKDKVSIFPIWEKSGIYVKATIVSEDHKSTAIIEGFHTNIVHLSIDNHMLSLPYTKKGEKKEKDTDLQSWLKKTSFQKLYDLITEDELHDLAEFLIQGIEMNLKLAKYGLDNPTSEAVGIALKKINNKEEKSLLNSIQVYLAAAVDARMGGAPLPAMSSAGSGNNGIVATLPIWCAYQYYRNIPEEKYLQALALSHVVTSKLKAHMGRVTPICSCSLAAGAGAAAGLSVLLESDSNTRLEVIERSIENHLLTLFGVICDGAKPSCALKLSNAGASALQSYFLAKEGIKISQGEGICGGTLDATLKNIEIFLSQAYLEVDKSLLSILSPLK